MSDSDRPDAGFTLPELLINIVILGVLSMGLATTFSVVVRTSPDAEARADDARSFAGLVGWFPEDVSSTPPGFDAGAAPGGFDVSPATVTGCSGESPGTNLLRLRWTETIRGTTTTYLASYRYVADGVGWRVKRFSCVAGGPAQVRVLTAVLTGSDRCPPASGRQVEVALIEPTPGVPRGARLSVSVDCATTVIRGLSNNLADELPPPQTAPTNTTTTVAAAATTTTTTAPVVDIVTTVPSSVSPTSAPTTTSSTVPACTSATVVSVAPQRVNNGSQQDISELKKSVVIGVSWTGYCPDLGILVDPHHEDGSGTHQPKWFSLQGGRTLTLLGRGGDLWSDGLHTLRLVDGADSTTVLATGTLEVQ